tara:strand:+ start:7399 stop:7809 length:411 start_codon:yes stop_codon:yes gene_type:complete
MATHAGHTGSIKAVTSIDGTGAPLAVAEVKDWSLETTANLADDTVLGNAWTSQKLTTKSWSTTLNCIWSNDDAAQQDFVEGGTVQVELYPYGETAGNTKWDGLAIVASVSKSAAADGLVEASFNLTGIGALTPGTA